MIYVRTFKASDLSAFVPIEALRPVEIDDPELAKAIEDSGLAVTGIRNGKIVGCGGVHPVTDTCGEVWLRLSQECLGFKIETVRLLKHGLKIMEETYQFEQLTTTAKCCFSKSISLIERCGFKKVRKVFDEGEHWFIYSKEMG